MASEDNEAELLEIGLAATATQCERICRTFRKVMAPGTGAEVEAQRRVSVREGDDGTVRVSVVLPADEGARFVASMDAAREVLDRDAPRGDEGGRHSRADGLMAVVEGWFSAEPRPRRGGAPNEVLLHVSADALRRSDVPAGTSAGASGESAAAESVNTPGRLRAQVELTPAQAGSLGAKAREVPAGAPAKPCGCSAHERSAAAEALIETAGTTTPTLDVSAKVAATRCGRTAHEAMAASTDACASVMTEGTAETAPDDTAPTLDVPAGTLTRPCGCTAPARGGCAEHETAPNQGFAYVDSLGAAGVDRETARRLACDASLVTIVEGTSGEVLDVARKRRTVPPAITRALEARRGRRCAFPGCEHTLFLDHHHIEHWADGGETKVDNLLLLCRHHHTFVHERGWTIERGPGGPTFVAPSGRRVEAAPRMGPVDLVALQDHLPGRAAERALCATGGWEAVDYPEIIHALAERRSARELIGPRRRHRRWS